MKPLTHSTHSTQTHYLSPANVATIVHRQGIAATLRGMVDAIHADNLQSTGSDSIYKQPVTTRDRPRFN